ncbi:MAG: endonuclease III [Clostridia bacterium]|nr:endonuclease III [Clostridia bacterium]MBQ5792501.1 endonuclease III [Clostridia bacterium]
MKNLKRTKQYKECRARFAEVSRRLAALYPGAECALEWRTDAQDPADDGWRLLIMGRLSAQCTDARVNIVCRELFAAYPSAKAVADAPIEDLERLVHSCGFFRAKASNIKECCRIMVEEYDGRVPADREVLLTFPGVGRKIANLLLGDIYHVPGIVADTHLICIGGRLGAYPTTMKDPHKVEKILDMYVEPSEQSNFCHRAVQFGRDFCTSRAPKCGECPLADICPYAKNEKT